MGFVSKKRKVLTTLVVCLIVMTELVQIYECSALMDAFKLIKKTKKLKKYLPLLLLGPKILIIKSGSQSQTTTSKTPSPPSDPCCPPIPCFISPYDYSSYSSDSYSDSYQNSNYNYNQNSNSNYDNKHDNYEKKYNDNYENQLYGNSGSGY